jgi:hypothetical protein
MVQDVTGHAGAPLIPAYDVIALSQIAGIVCVRPNRVIRAAAPQEEFVVNRFIIKNQLVFRKDPDAPAEHCDSDLET